MFMSIIVPHILRLLASLALYASPSSLLSTSPDIRRSLTLSICRILLSSHHHNYYFYRCCCCCCWYCAVSKHFTKMYTISMIQGDDVIIFCMIGSANTTTPTPTPTPTSIRAWVCCVKKLLIACLCVLIWCFLLATILTDWKHFPKEREWNLTNRRTIGNVLIHVCNCCCKVWKYCLLIVSNRNTVR